MGIFIPTTRWRIASGQDLYRRISWWLLINLAYGYNFM